MILKKTLIKQTILGFALISSSAFADIYTLVRQDKNYSVTYDTDQKESLVVKNLASEDEPVSYKPKYGPQPDASTRINQMYQNRNYIPLQNQLNAFTFTIRIQSTMKIQEGMAGFVINGEEWTVDSLIAEAIIQQNK